MIPASPSLPAASHVPLFPGGRTPLGAGLHMLLTSYCPVFLPSPHQSGSPHHHLYPEPSQPTAPQAASSLHPLSYPNAPFCGFIFLRGSYHPWVSCFIGICSLARHLFLSGIYASKEKEAFPLVPTLLLASRTVPNTREAVSKYLFNECLFSSI